MFNALTRLLNLPNGADPTLDKDKIAALLQTSPEALAQFEAAYTAHALNQAPNDFFQTNSRQAAEKKHSIDPEAACAKAQADIDAAKELVKRIIDELLAQTSVYVYDGKQADIKAPKALPAGAPAITNEDIQKLPAELRPEAAGNLMKVDIGEPSYPHLLYFYDQYLHESNPKKRQMAYHMFRQGLDILDLDPVTYEIIGTNPTSMGHWLPQLVNACAGQDFFKIPKTRIAKVPLSLLQLTRQEYSGLTQTTLDIVDQWAYKAFNLDKDKEYFIKTGTYSSKFDFRNAHVHGAKEVRELGEYLLYIHFQALQMASPTCTPCMYGVSTTNEWVVREFIPDKENNPCIYKGLPLHTEYRVFVDCDSDEVLRVVPYWDPDTMKQRFGHKEDADSVHNMHDYVIYKAHEETLMSRYDENKGIVAKHIADILPGLDLHGQWSIDVMQNGDEFWLIDMAIAENSAFYDRVPKELRRPSEENWIPSLPSVETN